MRLLSTVRLHGVNATRSRLHGVNPTCSRALLSTSAAPAGPVVEDKPGRELTVFYDGACPICAKEISHLSHLDESPSGQCAIDFVDLSTVPDDDTLRKRLGTQSTTRADAMMSLHIVNNNTGVVSTGVDSFVQMWSRLPYWKTFSRLFSVPGVMPVANAVYGVWARNRHVSSRWFKR
jgi:predicted DCC family thiol-disulfide oxidoreductase YuxK